MDQNLNHFELHFNDNEKYHNYQRGKSYLLYIQSRMSYVQIDQLLCYSYHPIFLNLRWDKSQLGQHSFLQISIFHCLDCTIISNLHYLHHLFRLLRDKGKGFLDSLSRQALIIQISNQDKALYNLFLLFFNPFFLTIVILHFHDFRIPFLHLEALLGIRSHQRESLVYSIIHQLFCKM